MAKSRILSVPEGINGITIGVGTDCKRHPTYFIEHNGVKKSIGDVSKEVKISKRTIYGRIFKLGWSVEEALTVRPKRDLHGMIHSTEYSIWNKMLCRCKNRNNPAYPDYGGRGIDVCERWMIFSNFFADMGNRPDGKTLERKNNDLGYEPGNVVWATKAEQSRNKRNNVWLTFGGKTMILTDWAIELGIHQRTLRNRIKNGWSVEKALTQSVQLQKGK